MESSKYFTIFPLVLALKYHIMEPRLPLEDMARSVFTAMNTRNFSELESCITEDIAFDFPGSGRLEGSKRVIIFLKALLRKYPKLTFTVSEVLLDSQRACAVWTNEGKNTEGIPYANSGITLIHFANNKICFISDYFKDTSFVQTS